MAGLVLDNIDAHAFFDVAYSMAVDDQLSGRAKARLQIDAQLGPAPTADAWGVPTGAPPDPATWGVDPAAIVGQQRAMDIFGPGEVG